MGGLHSDGGHGDGVVYRICHRQNARSHSASYSARWDSTLIRSSNVTNIRQVVLKHRARAYSLLSIQAWLRFVLVRVDLPRLALCGLIDALPSSQRGLRRLLPHSF